MAKQRKTIGARQKAKVALEAIKEQSTIRELSTKYKIHTTQINSWKKKLIDESPELFERGYAGSREQEFQQRESELFEEIGRLKMELEWLKKKADQFS
jgi:transposase